MNELDKLIARMGFQLVQYELALSQAQNRIAELEDENQKLRLKASQPSPEVAFPPK